VGGFRELRLGRGPPISRFGGKKKTCLGESISNAFEYFKPKKSGGKEGIRFKENDVVRPVTTAKWTVQVQERKGPIRGQEFTGEEPGESNPKSKNLLLQ